MPSKLQKAIAAVKDQTSISLAKVKTTSGGGGRRSSSAAALEVAILKATTHDDAPVSEQHVQQILWLASSSRGHAWACARALGRRISRTRNWAVALKSLVLVLRLFQDGDPHFPKEVLSAMKHGYKILNLSSFSAAGSASWHFTAFVRTLALYLDERLHCFLTGKLVHRRRRPIDAPPPLDMKPPLLLDRVSHWQRLLDRAIGTRPTGPAKSNRLVQACLYAVVQESFDLYRDISDGLALLLDSFFHLPHASSARAYEACVKASRQFSDLAAFYESCKAAGVGGRTSDYPSVTGMSEELLDTLHDFLKDQQQQADFNPTPRTTTFHGRDTSLEDLIGDVSSDEKPIVSDDIDLASVMSDPTSTNCSALEWLELDDDYDGLSRTGWELALLEAVTLQSTTDNIDCDSSSSPFLASSPHQYNPFLQDQDAFHSTHAFFHATSTSGYVQPTFWSDLHHDNGNGSPLDLFGTFEGGNDNAHSGAPVSSLTNANPETISNAIGMPSPLDQFATLSIGSTI